LYDWIALNAGQEDTDSVQGIRPLRAHGERPHHWRCQNQLDEIAPLHRLPPPTIGLYSHRIKQVIGVSGTDFERLKQSGQRRLWAKLS
jgi:hypothetical protein